MVPAGWSDGAAIAGAGAARRRRRRRPDRPAAPPESVPAADIAVAACRGRGRVLASGAGAVESVGRERQARAGRDDMEIRRVRGWWWWRVAPGILVGGEARGADRARRTRGRWSRQPGTSPSTVFCWLWVPDPRTREPEERIGWAVPKTPKPLAAVRFASLIVLPSPPSWPEIEQGFFSSLI